jgi:hypothetical protein
MSTDYKKSVSDEAFKCLESSAIEKELIVTPENVIKFLPQGMETRLTTITAHIKVEREYIKNLRMKEGIKICRQAYCFRWILFLSLLGLMFAETVLLVVFVYFYSHTSGSNPINNTTLQVIVGATILQISAMVIVIVKSSFPASIKDLIDALSDKS